MIIAVDGPAASGKGTLARRLAQHYGLRYLDTGSLYRAVAWKILAQKADPNDVDAAVMAARGLNPKVLDDPALRGPGVGEAASIVAKMPEVRNALLGFQRAFADQRPGAVLDGRDIGTVICPNADVKIFVTASPEARAKRRYLELKAKGEDVTEPKIFELIRIRDERDQFRTAAPLRRAEDAHLLDTSNLDIDAVFRTAVELIDAVVSRAGCA